MMPTQPNLGSTSAGRPRRGRLNGDRRPKPRTNAQWSAETIAALTRRARQEFARAGYAEASVDRIADQAGLTKGAIYYHFGGKEGLFEAALRDVQRDIVERIEARAITAADPSEVVVAGCNAFLDVALDDELRQIALADGPRVLGWSKWRAIDGEFGLGSLKEALHACKRAGGLGRSDPETLAHLISGALNEAVFMVAESVDRAATHALVAKTVKRFLQAVVA